MARRTAVCCVTGGRVGRMRPQRARAASGGVTELLWSRQCGAQGPVFSGTAELLLVLPLLGIDGSIQGVPKIIRRRVIGFRTATGCGSRRNRKWGGEEEMNEIRKALPIEPIQEVVVFERHCKIVTTVLCARHGTPSRRAVERSEALHS